MQRSILREVEPFSYIRCAAIPGPSLNLSAFYYTALLSKHVQYLILVRHFTFPKHCPNTS